jgi:hypothetical protein
MGKLPKAATENFKIGPRRYQTMRSIISRNPRTPTASPNAGRGVRAQ